MGLERSSSRRLARRYGQVADVAVVERRADVPAAFTWRRRRYAVEQVVAQWREVSEWWRARAVARLLDSAGTAHASASIDDRERECWRVEARCLRTGRVGVYDLCCDLTTGEWTVARTHD